MSRHFILVRLGSLGDVVHALPTLATLRASFPHARIDWVIEERWQPLIELNPGLSNVIPVDTHRWRRGLLRWSIWKEARAAVRGLQEARPDVALDLQGLYKSALLARLSGARQRIGFHRSALKEPGASLWYTQRVVPPENRHVLEMNLALARAAGAESVVIRFPLPTMDEEESYVEEQLQRQHLRDYFVLSPGGGWGSKCWPVERYALLQNALARERGWRCFLNLGPGEEPLMGEFLANVRVAKPVSFPLGLRQLVALLRRAKVVVSGDTGALHLAAALGTPVVGLFGPTDPMRNGPYAVRPGQVGVVHHPEASPVTYKHQGGTSPAMLAITVEEVKAAVDRVLEVCGG